MLNVIDIKQMQVDNMKFPVETKKSKGNSIHLVNFSWNQQTHQENCWFDRLFRQVKEISKRLIGLIYICCRIEYVFG